MIESITKDGVAVLAMRHGKANALDTELCQALCGALDEATAEGAAAVVLTGAGPARALGHDRPVRRGDQDKPARDRVPVDRRHDRQLEGRKAGEGAPQLG